MFDAVDVLGMLLTCHNEAQVTEATPLAQVEYLSSGLKEVYCVF